MELEDIFEQYCSKMERIQYNSRLTSSVAKDQIKKLSKYYEDTKDILDESIPHESHSMFFPKAFDGQPYFYGRLQITIKERIKYVHLSKNRQYQWLLCEAYEEFEDCLENFYAYEGYHDRNFWPLEDYGNISLAELENMTFSCYQTRASKKKGAPKTILTALRKKYTQLESIEKDNALEMNLRFLITLVEQFRHIIVHRNGVVGDREAFLESVLQKSGISKKDKTYEGFMNQFFGRGKYSNTVMLLEVPIERHIPIGIHINMFDRLFEIMLTYVHAIYTVLRESIKA